MPLKSKVIKILLFSFLTFPFLSSQGKEGSFEYASWGLCQENVKIRLMALNLLEKVSPKTPSSAYLLSCALHDDKSSQIREKAAFILKNIISLEVPLQPTEVEAKLIDKLVQIIDGSEKPYRLIAINFLEKTPRFSLKAVPSLVLGIKDPDVEISEKSKKVLNRLQLTFTKERWCELEKIRHFLTLALFDESLFVRTTSFKFLSVDIRSLESSKETLLLLAREPNESLNLRCEIASSLSSASLLSKADNSFVLKLFVENIDNKDLQSIIMEGLWPLIDSRYRHLENKFLLMLYSSDQKLQLNAIKALGNMGPNVGDVAKPLSEFLDKQGELRIAAAVSLYKINTAETRAILNGAITFDGNLLSRDIAREIAELEKAENNTK